MDTHAEIIVFFYRKHAIPPLNAADDQAIKSQSLYQFKEFRYSPVEIRNFHAFDKAHPEIYFLLEDWSFRAMASGRHHYSGYPQFNDMVWNTTLKTVDKMTEYKISHN